MIRRRLLLSGLGGATVLGAWLLVSSRDEEIIEMVVRKRLDYLKLDPDGVRRFARDFAAIRSVSRARLRMLAGLKPIYTNFRLSDRDNSMSHLLRHGEDRIVGSYLISSDFFLSGSDELRVVNYLGLLDPLRACGNPFARHVMT